MPLQTPATEVGAATYERIMAVAAGALEKREWRDSGGDLVSTRVAKQSRACQGPVTLLNSWKPTNANDERYALAA
jgi:hypothetical protein